MKKIFLTLLMAGLAFNCSSDDDGSGNQNVEQNNAIVRITNVDTEADEITLTNRGGSTIDVANYWVCLGPGTYAQVSTTTDASTSLEPDADIVLSYDVNVLSGGLGLFSEGGSFGSSDPTILVDYIQWGAANQARSAQAVTAGRWNDATIFVEDASPYIFDGEATDFGSDEWEGQPIDARVRITGVDTATQQITITNFGEDADTADVGDYWICFGPGTYQRIGVIATESTILEANQSITITSANVQVMSGGLGLFSRGGAFASTDPTVLLDYVQWGTGSQARSAQAVTAGRWDDAATTTEGNSPYTFVGRADLFGSDVWTGI